MPPLPVPASLRKQYVLACEHDAYRTRMSLLCLGYAVLMALYAVLLSPETSHRVYGLGTLLLCLIDTALVLRTHADREKTHLTGWMAAGAGFVTILHIFSKQLAMILTSRPS